MRNEGEIPRPPPPFIADGSRAAVIAALDAHNRRAQWVARVASGMHTPSGPVPPPRPFITQTAAQDAAMFAVWEADRQRSFIASAAGRVGPVYTPEDDFPVLVSQSVVTSLGTTAEGQLIRALTLPLLDIVRLISNDPKLMYQVDPRKWEEIVAAAYEASGRFDRVILTPRSGDYGRDLIAEKDGFGSVRLIESVKRYTPGHAVTADEVRALSGVLAGDHKATKGVISTTWEFAPRLREDAFIKPFLPYRLELVNGSDLVERLREYTSPECG